MVQAGRLQAMEDKAMGGGIQDSGLEVEETHEPGPGC